MTNKIQEAINKLVVLETDVRNGSDIPDVDVTSIIELLHEANQPKGREGPVITRNEDGIIVCVTWQDDEGHIIDVLAESHGYPALKKKADDGMEVVQNLLAAFPDAITPRKSNTEPTNQAFEKAMKYVDEHKVNKDEDEYMASLMTTPLAKKRDF